jgi:plasmid replication initiation protein
VIAWLTPDDAPGTPVTVELTIPGGEEYAAILRGALVLLFDPANFELFGSQTPETVAQAFVDAMHDLEVSA